MPRLRFEVCRPPGERARSPSSLVPAGGVARASSARSTYATIRSATLSSEGALRLLIVPSVVLTLAMPCVVGAQSAGPAGDEPPLRQHLMRPLPPQEPGQDGDAAQVGVPEMVITLQEGAVDPATYRIGPDDRLQLAIWGAAELYYPLRVLPEGSVFVPDVGLVDVAGLSLDEARARVTKAVLEVFSNVRVNVVLSELRRFKVHVVGAVAEPGPYPATAVTRVSEVIELAGGALDVASLRGIRIRDDRGVTNRVDLVAYELTGGTERNPFVSDGAVVEVPRRTSRLLLSGAVVNPGIYEPFPGERLSEALRAVGGLTPWADSSAVTMTTFENADDAVTRTFEYRPGTESGDPVLSDGDAVFVRERPDWHRVGQAFVYGAVRAPGRYPIPIDGIPLTRLIQTAGGFTARANLAQVHVRRPSERFTPVPPEDQELPAVGDRFARDQRLMELEADTVLVRGDFVRLFKEGDTTREILVRDGDVVQVPEDRAEVRMLGLVRRPGAYPYVRGADVGDYVEAAGGYDKDADKSRARLAPFYGAPLRNVRKGDAVASGAIIHIPEKERRSFIERTRDVTAIVVQVASLVLLVDRIAR